MEENQSTFDPASHPQPIRGYESGGSGGMMQFISYLIEIDTS